MLPSLFRRNVIFAALIAGALSGCDKKTSTSATSNATATSFPIPTEASVIGKWKVAKAAGGEAIGPGWDHDFAVATLNLKPDHTYHAYNAAVGGYNGNWSLSGSTLSLVIGDDEWEMMTRKPTLIAVEGATLRDGDPGSIVLTYQRIPDGADAPVFKGTAADYVAGMTDEAAFKTKYKEKTVELEGLVTEAKGGPMEYGQATISIAGPGAPNDELGKLKGSVTCVPIDHNPQLRLSRGQRVKIRGQAYDFSGITGATVIECEIVETGPTTGVVIGAADLAREWAKNADAAKAKYMISDYVSKTMRVTGTLLEKKAEDPTERYKIFLGEGDARILCNFGSDKKIIARLSELEPGATVSLVGDFSGAGDKYPSLDSCMLPPRTGKKPVVVAEPVAPEDSQESQRAFAATLEGPPALPDLDAIHTGDNVRSIIPLPDGKSVIITGGSFDQVAGIWDLASHAQTKAFAVAGKYGINSVLLAGATTLAATNGWNLEFRDATTGAVRNSVVVGAGEGGISALAGSPDGKSFATTGSDGAIHLWTGDLQAAPRILVPASKGSVSAISFSPDGTELAAAIQKEGTFASVLTLYNTATGGVLHSFGDDIGGITATLWSPDGKFLIATGYGGKLFVFDPAAAKLAKTVDIGVDISAMLFIDRGNKLITSTKQTLRIWNFPSCELIGMPIFGPRAEVDCLATTNDGKTLLTGDTHGDVKRWNIAELAEHPEKFQILGNEKESFMAHPHGGATSLALTPDNKTLFTNADDGAAGLWDLKTHKRLLTIPAAAGAILPSAISPDGQLIAYGNGFSEVRVVKLSDGSEVKSFNGEGFLTGIAFTRDSKTVITATGKNVTKWNLDTGEKVFTFPAEPEEITAMALFPDNKQIATGGKENKVKIWDLSTGKLVKKFSAEKDKIISIRITPDGKRLASEALAGNFRLYDIESGKQLRALSLNNSGIFGMAILPDGKTLVCPHHRDIVVVDLDAGRVIKILQGHLDLVNDIIVTSDGRRIISCSGDGTVKVWDVP